MNKTGGLRAIAAVTGAVLIVGVLAITAGPAVAAQYVQDVCKHPDNAIAPTDGFAAAVGGSPFVYTQDNCGGGGSLDASFDGGVSHDYGTFGRWQLNAPAGTTIAAVTGVRSAGAGASQPYGTPVVAMYTDQGVVSSCSSLDSGGCGPWSGAFSLPLGSVSSFVFAVQCGGSGGGVCPASPTGVSVGRMQITYNDDNAPAFAGTPSGNLLSESTVTRNRTVNFSATDSGGGLYQERLYDAGTLISQSVIDTNNGHCALYGSAFSYRQPCRTSASGSINLDTATLSDGGHDLSLVVVDAAGNPATYGPWSVKVDNRPPSVTGANLTGTPVVGETLTCAATVIGQSPSVSYAWFRTAADGSGETLISGATASSYTLTAQDAEKKILCQVSGTDGGGTASAKTTVTTPPFNNGATVQGTGVSGSQKPTQEAPKGNPAPEPVAAAAPAAVAPSNGSNAGEQAVVKAAWVKGGRTRLTSRWNEAPSLRGTVTNAATGRPIGGALLDVNATAAYPGARTRQMTGVKTRDDGTFTVKVPLGVSSRRLQLVYRPVVNGPAVGGSTVLSLIVRAEVSLRSVRSLGRTLTLSGRLASGPFPKVGPVIEVEVRKGTGWQVFATGRAGRGGRFTLRYRASSPFPRGTVFVFRARLRPTSSYPYAGGTSAPRRFTVRR